MLVHSDDQGRSCGRNAQVRLRKRPDARKKPLGNAEGLPGLPASNSICAGFSLLELLASIAVMLVVAGGVISSLSYSEKTYARTEQQSDMYENVRAVAELMAQEVGQAGLVSLPGTPTLSAAVSPGTTAQTIPVSSTTSMFVGENLVVDTAASSESVQLTAVTTNSISAIFTLAHASGAVIHVLGVAPGGIVPPGTTDGSTSNSEPGVSVLNLFGDLNSDGSLVYVRYTCDTTNTPGTLTRSVTTITPGNNTISTAQTLLSTLIQNPGGTPCFQFEPNITPSPVNGVSYTLVPNVGLTISVQSVRPDPMTGQYLTMTKSFLDLSPRNILAGYEQANWGDASRLQIDPPNASLY